VKIDYVEEGLSRRHLDFEVPEEEVARAFEAQAGELGRRLKIPGFRKGKIPKELVKSRFRSEILNEVVQDLVPRALERALTERALTPLENPHIGKVEVALGRPLRFRASFEVMPQVEVKQYQGLRVTHEPATVDPTEVEKRLEVLREKAARFDPIGDRAARDGDYVLGNLEEKVVGQPGSGHQQKGAVVELGKDHGFPMLDENLRGARPGETVAFEASFPSDHPDPGRAGKTYAVRFEVLELKEKTVPPLDDELAKDLGDFGSLAELRADVEKTALEQARQRSELALRQKLLERLVEANSFDAPAALVDLELDRRMEEAIRALVAQGVDVEKARIDWRGLRESQRAAAETSVRATLLLDRLTVQENIQTSAEDIEREIAELASRLGRSPDAVRAQLLKEGGLERLERRLRRDRAIDFLKQNARIERG
jgi:trigger factor